MHPGTIFTAPRMQGSLVFCLIVLCDRLVFFAVNPPVIISIFDVVHIAWMHLRSGHTLVNFVSLLHLRVRVRVCFRALRGAFHLL